MINSVASIVIQMTWYNLHQIMIEERVLENNFGVT
jgi:hypothetical protein